MLAERAVRHPDVVRLVMREVLARPRVLSEHDESTADLDQSVGGGDLGAGRRAVSFGGGRSRRSRR